MRVRAALTALALLLLAPNVALASLADEQRQGQALTTQLQSGAKSCSDLSSEDLDHIGEYLMGRALGSTSVHQAMNDRMRLMLGDQAEGRMHQLMGARFAGCAVRSSSGHIMSPGMMSGGYSGNGGWGAMMGSRDYSWMAGDAWRHMSRQDWQSLRRRWLGTSAAHHGWSAWAIAALALVGLILGTAIALGARRGGAARYGDAGRPSSRAPAIARTNGDADQTP